MKPIKSRAALLFVVSFYVVVLLPLIPVWAQGLNFPADADLFAPVIRHEPPGQAITSGSSFRFMAKITDNVGVGKVTLFYRTVGEEVKKPLAPKETAPVLTEEFFPTERESIALRTGKTLEKPWYKKWWVWTLALVVVGGGVAAAGGGGGEEAATGSVEFSGATP